MPDMKNKFAIRIYVLLVLLAGSIIRADAQAAPPEGAQQFAELGEMKLQGGAAIQDFRLGYRTLGNLNTQNQTRFFCPTGWAGNHRTCCHSSDPARLSIRRIILSCCWTLSETVFLPRHRTARNSR